MLIKRQNGYGLSSQTLLAWLAATIFLSIGLALALFWGKPPQVEAWQLWVRYTARLSFILFLASYLASPLYELTQTNITEWLRRNRRNAGISFSIAHIIHLGALIGFFVVSGAPVDMATIIVGGGAYIAMFAMLVTSNDAAIRKIGQANWGRLHKFGAHYLAFVFVFPTPAVLPRPIPNQLS